MDMGLAVRAQHIFLSSGLFSIPRLLKMEPHHYFYDLKGRLYSFHLYAYGLGTASIDHRNTGPTHLFTGTDRDDIY